MLDVVRPFKALRPVVKEAHAVAAPPYDVLNSDEARQKVAGRPNSFLHISKPEIDLPHNIDPYAARVYEMGAENLARMIDDGVLIREKKACYYAYKLSVGAHNQVGVALVASVDYYDSNFIKKHEFTRPKKEDDRVRQIEALDAQTGPVLLAHPKNSFLKTILDQVIQTQPLYEVLSEDGVKHTVWCISEINKVSGITSAFESMSGLYIADGHHRSAASSRVAKSRLGSDSAQYFLAVAFAETDMRILDYNRVIKDLNGYDIPAVLEKISQDFCIEKSTKQVSPDQSRQFGMYLGGSWFKLDLKTDKVINGGPVSHLDVSILQSKVIKPIFEISDPRKDERIDFVGGIRGLSELEKRVNSGEMSIAFSLFPTAMAQLISVANAGKVMPPKSTWFEPKLVDGLLSHVLD